MRELALFAGAGGGILAGGMLGWRTVCAVEIEPYARAVLEARQADGSLHSFPVHDDVRTFDGRPWRGRVGSLRGWPGDCGAEVGNPDGARLAQREGESGDDGAEFAPVVGADRGAAQPGIRRTDDGLAIVME